MVADDDGLLGLSDGETPAALHDVSLLAHGPLVFFFLYNRMSSLGKRRGEGGLSYRSCVNAAVLGAGHDEALAADVQTLAESLVFCVGVAVHDGRDNLHLFRLEL